MAANAPEPLIRRKFVLADLSDNHNKVWMIELWADGRCVCSWGRVGDAGQSKEFTGWTSYMVNDKIAEKQAKGYREIDLNKGVVAGQSHTSALKSVAPSPRRDAFIANIFAESGEYIQTYLSVGVDELSQRQIEAGREVLRQIQNAKNRLSVRVAPLPMVEYYYNLIPTQLSRKIDPIQLAEDFNLSEQENRLNQLEAALSTFTSQASGNSQYASLGAEIVEVDAQSKTYAAIQKYLKDTGEREWRTLEGVYKVCIPQERAAWDADTVGKEQVSSLWHGTKAQNVRHILKAGFRIPDISSNGKMFGSAIYFADKAAKSMRYTSANRGPRMMFLSDVAIGTPYIAKEAQNFRSPPSGFDSVMGKAGHTASYGGKLLNNEYVIFSPTQATIRFIVAFR